MENFERFMIYILAIVLVYLAQTCFKLKKVRKEKTFTWKCLLDGLIDNSFYFLGAILLFLSGMLLPDIKVSIITIPESNQILDLCTIDIMFILATSLYISQATKAFNNIKDNYDIKNISEIKEEPINLGNGVSK